MTKSFEQRMVSCGVLRAEYAELRAEDDELQAEDDEVQTEGSVL